MTLTARLPLPPSVNYGLRRTMTARLSASRVKRRYSLAVLAALREQVGTWEPLTGRVSLSVELHMARRGGGDLSNRVKALEDALTVCRVWLDDSQVDALHVTRGEVVSGGAAAVVVEALGAAGDETGGGNAVVSACAALSGEIGPEAYIPTLTREGSERR